MEILTAINIVLLFSVIMVVAYIGSIMVLSILDWVWFTLLEKFTGKKN